MNITSLGIGSGLDLEGIVEAFINAEAIPEEARLQKRKDEVSVELSGVSSFKSSLSTFDNILEKLSADDAFNKQVLNVSSEDIEVTTNGFASSGSFSVEVEKLAQSTQRQSQTFTSSSDTVGSGTLTFGAGADSFTVTIAATDTLSDIRDKVNEEAGNFGVTANILNVDSGSYLVFDSDKTGTANALTISTSDASLNDISINTTETRLADDAIIHVDGNQITSDTNTFKNVIEDVTIEAKKVNFGLGTPATLDITQDTENGTELINEFVDGFNALMSDISGLGAPKVGRLAFDPNLRSVKQQMVNIVLDEVPGMSGAIKSLNDIGIELDKNGQFIISSFSATTLPSGEEKLSGALENNLEEVGKLFASSDGIANKMSELIKSYTDSDGTLTSRATALNKQLEEVEQGYVDLEERLRDYESTLRKRFTFLDATVSQYNATSSYLTSTLASISGTNDD